MDVSPAGWMFMQDGTFNALFNHQGSRCSRCSKCTGARGARDLPEAAAAKDQEHEEKKKG
jgi:hypothetical protein